LEFWSEEDFASQQGFDKSTANQDICVFTSPNSLQPKLLQVEQRTVENAAFRDKVNTLFWAGLDTQNIEKIYKIRSQSKLGYIICC